MRVDSQAKKTAAQANHERKKMSRPHKRCRRVLYCDENSAEFVKWAWKGRPAGWIERTGVVWQDTWSASKQNGDLPIYVWALVLGYCPVQTLVNVFWGCTSKAICALIWDKHAPKVRCPMPLLRLDGSNRLGLLVADYGDREFHLRWWQQVRESARAPTFAPKNLYTSVLHDDLADAITGQADPEHPLPRFVYLPGNMLNTRIEITEAAGTYYAQGTAVPHLRRA